MTESITNWLGQELTVGSKVYRGARDGNASSFKVGVVTKLAPFTVNWLFEPKWYNQPGSAIRVDSTGRPSEDTVVLIDEETWNRLDQTALSYDGEAEAWTNKAGEVFKS